MRQISDMPSTQVSDSASARGFFASKGRCGRGFRNLPHTTVLSFRKCGVKPRFAGQTPVLCFRDLLFCCRKPCCAQWFSIFPPHFRKSGVSVAAFGLQMFRIQQENGRAPRLCMHFLMLLIINTHLQLNRLKASSQRALF